LIGTAIAHYRILDKLGEGGMGVVYVAEDTALSRTVALKALPRRFVQDPQRRKRFAGEARAAAMLNHPGIAAIYEFIEDGDGLYIAMELVRGESLRAHVKVPPLPLQDVLEISIQITRALVAAHAQGIIHRDLKPENILRTQTGTIKILDFGLARFVSTLKEGITETAHVTSSGTVMGTVAYMSPEQLEGKPVDTRSDIFSVGVIIYELATGSHPFDRPSAASTIVNILTVEPRALAELRVIAPAELERIIRKCLRKEPAHRYQTTAELSIDLEALHLAISNRNATPHQDSHTSQTIISHFFRAVERSPQRWWELNQYFCLAAFPLIAYWIWRVRDWLSANWSPWLVFMTVLLVSSTMTMRLYLLITAGFHPDNLRGEVLRWARIIRFTTSAIWLLLGTVAALILRQHLGIASFMGGVAVGGWLSTMVAEEAIDTQAFPR
jgi:serine/threonine protein kinase